MERFQPNLKKQTVFKPEKSVLEHVDDQHEELLERKEFDFEYQKEFRDFFLKTFKEVNLNISEGFKDVFELPPDKEASEKMIKSAYLGPSSYISSAVTPSDPRDRLWVDERLSKEFKEDGINLSAKDLDEQITKAYMEKVDLGRLLSLMVSEKDPARKNLLLLIIQVINPKAISKMEGEVELKTAKSAPSVGQCIKSEKHMLAYLSGEHIKPEGGYTNLIVDDSGSPVMLEKVNLGDTHSCISLKPTRIGGVSIPAGAVLSAEPDIFEPIRSKIKWFTKRRGAINYVTKLDNYKGFKFVRMSLISLPEEIRSSAGGGYYLHQQNKTKGYINYDWVTPEIITQYAKSRFNLEK